MMINWLHYLLEANLYLAVAYSCYWLLFRKQTFYTANRLYLLMSTIICFIIPVVQIDYLRPAPQLVQPVQTTTQINYIAPTAISPPSAESILTPNKAITAIYSAVAIVFLIFFLIKLYSLFKLILRNQRIRQQNYTLVCLKQASTPFSFFGYLFVNGRHNLQETVLRHELVHIKQKHSLDIVFVELLKIVNWFNPVVYLLQNSLKALHEYEADQSIAGNNQQDDYVAVLVSQAYQSSGVPFVNYFSNQQLLKSRIMKLYQKRSGSLARLNYLLTVPLCAGLLCASSLAFSKNYGWVKLNFQKPIIKEAPLSALKDTAKRLRLKVTIGSVTGITDKLELKGNKGKKLIFTAQNLTAQDKRDLMQNFGIKVETTDASTSTTSIMVPPPPPPTKMPASAKQQVSKGPIKFPPPKVETIKFPPPKVEQVKFAPPQHAMKAPLKNTSDSATKSTFLDMFKHLQHTLRYPKNAKDNNVAGAVLVTFKVDNDQHISNVVIKKGAHPDLDAETLKNISSYNNTLQAKPGTYTMLVDYVLDNGDGTRTTNPKKIIEQEIPTAGEVVVVGYCKKK